MKLIKTTMSLTIVFALLLGSINLAGAEFLHYQKGDKIRDFTFTTYDNQVITLSEVLEKKEAVLINIWATWCGPCRNEFPYLEEAYKQYQDKVEVIALSCEPTDTPAALASFASEYGLTFKIGQDPVGFLSALRIGSIPTSLVVDRFGTICFIETGSQPDVSSFTRLFDVFLGDDYTESILLDGIPAAKPNTQSSTDAELRAALETAAINPVNEHSWPMVATEKDGRYVVASSNAGFDNTTAEVSVSVTASAGDVIAVSFKTSTEAARDLMTISVNGLQKKVFGGEHDWMTYAIPVQYSGSHEITLSYVKNQMFGYGHDTVWVDSVKILTGEEASAALAANPVYPTAAENALYVTSPLAKEIHISDDNGLLYANFGPAKYFIINDVTASFQAALSSAYDPEASFFISNYDGTITPVAANNYLCYSNVDSIETTGYTFTAMYLYADATGSDIKCIVFFKDEAHVNMFVNANNLGTWSYINTTQPSGLQPVTSFSNDVTYIITCVDQYGEPVIGAMMQICDESTCQVLISDTNGHCVYTGASYPWEVHVLMAPSGYRSDSNDIVLAPDNGGVMTFTFTKD